MYTDVSKLGMISVTCESLELMWITSSVYKHHDTFCSSTDNYSLMIFYPVVRNTLLKFVHHQIFVPK